MRCFARYITRETVRRIAFLAFGSILPFFLYSQTNPAEQALCDCIYTAYANSGVDLKAELDTLEKHWIKEGQLADSSGESYMRIYEAIRDSGDNPIRNTLDRPSLNNSSFRKFTNCFNSPKLDSMLRESESKIPALRQAYDSLYQTGMMDMPHVVEAMLTVLEPSDFETEFYRLYALLTFYYTANQSLGLKANEPKGPVIELKVFENGDLLVDNEPCTISELTKRIEAIRETYTEEELAFHSILLKVDYDTKMAVITDIKVELRKIQALKLKYSTFRTEEE